MCRHLRYSRMGRGRGRQASHFPGYRRAFCAGLSLSIRSADANPICRALLRAQRLAKVKGVKRSCSEEHYVASARCCSNCRGSTVRRRRPNRGFTLLPYVRHLRIKRLYSGRALKWVWALCYGSQGQTLAGARAHQSSAFSPCYLLFGICG